MGRAKLKMELISKEKPRITTFKKRKEGLMRKMYEFTSLCDVKACLIIYGPKLGDESCSDSPEIWPKDEEEEVRRVASFYRERSKESGGVKTYGLRDFFDDRRKKIEGEVDRMRKKNMEMKYPTWMEFMDRLPESELREFAVRLNNKQEIVKNRLEMLMAENGEAPSGYYLLEAPKLVDQAIGYNDINYVHNLNYPYDQLYGEIPGSGALAPQPISSMGPINGMHAIGETSDLGYNQMTMMDPMPTDGQDSMIKMLMNDANDYDFTHLAGYGGSSSNINNMTNVPSGHELTVTENYGQQNYRQTLPPSAADYAVVDESEMLMRCSMLPLTRPYNNYVPNYSFQQPMPLLLPPPYVSPTFPTTMPATTMSSGGLPDQEHQYSSWEMQYGSNNGMGASLYRPGQ